MEPLPPARFALRAAAKLADAVLVIWLAGAATAVVVALAVGSETLAAGTPTTQGLVVDSFFLLLAPLVFFVYQTLFLGAWGATPGKLLWGLEVTADERPRLGFGGAALRSLAEFPGVLFGAPGFLAHWWSTRGDPPGLALHDRMTKTRAVQVQEPAVRWRRRSWPRRALGASTAALLVLAATATLASIPWLDRLRGSLQPVAVRATLAGNRALAAGDHGAALVAYTKAIAADSSASLAWANRGAVYGDLGRLENQIEDCSRALALDSTQVFALLGRANACRLQRRWPEALADYSAVIRQRPEWSGSLHALRGRGAVYFQTGRFDLAAADFDRAVRVAREHSIGTSDYVKGGDYWTNVEMCQWFRCEALRAMGQPEAADEEWRRSRSGPEIVSPEVRRGWTRDWLGR